MTATELVEANRKRLQTKLGSLKQSEIVEIVKPIVKGHGMKFPDVNRRWKHQNPKKCLIKWATDYYHVELVKHFDLPKSPLTPTPTIPPSPSVPTPPAFQEKPEPANTSDPLAGIIELVANKVLEKSIRKDQIQEIVADSVKKAIAGQPSEKIVVNTATGYSSKIKTTSKYFKEVLELCTVPAVNVCMTGPAGCGKTELARQVATALGYKFVSVSLTAGVSEGHLTGWLLPVGDSGKFIHVDSPVLKAWMEGNCVILFDEMDAADPNTMLIANQMLANGFMFLAQRHEKPEVHRGENVVILSAMNTFGNGADMLYAGRNQQDGATMDRFEFVEMTHDKTLEAKITPDEALTEWASKIRKNIKKFKLNKNLSTRRLVRYRNLMAANKTLGYLENKFFIGWSADERKKALTEVE